MFILQNWKQYFDDHHEGLGTTYERFILHDYFAKIKDRYGIKNVLEVPSFGMTGVSGINSLWWAANGAEVTLIDDNRERMELIEKVWRETRLEVKVVSGAKAHGKLPFNDKTFDLGWNFAGLWFVPELDEFLNELSRVSKKVIFICVPNSNSIFNAPRLSALKKQGDLCLESIDAKRIKEVMTRLGWLSAEEGWLDCPPWPDIAMKKEDLLKNIGLSFLVKQGKAAEDNCLCILDYFNGKNKNMEKEIRKHSWLENSPGLFKRFWAHHRYFIFIPKGNDL